MKFLLYFVTAILFWGCTTAVLDIKPVDRDPDAELIGCWDYVGLKVQPGCSACPWRVGWYPKCQGTEAWYCISRPNDGGSLIGEYKTSTPASCLMQGTTGGTFVHARSTIVNRRYNWREQTIIDGQLGVNSIGCADLGETNFLISNDSLFIRYYSFSCPSIVLSVEVYKKR